MEKIKKPAGGQSGFSLVEVLIATLVLAVGLLSVASAFTHGMLILANTPIQLAAKELAYEIIDEIVLRYDADSTSIPPGQYLLNGTIRQVREGRGFDAEANVTIIPDPNPGLTVVATVTYTINGNARTYITPAVTINALPGSGGGGS